MNEEIGFDFGVICQETQNLNYTFIGTLVYEQMVCTPYIPHN